MASIRRTAVTKAREVIARASPNDFSNQAFPFGTAQEIEIGMGVARGHRSGQEADARAASIGIWQAATEAP